MEGVTRVTQYHVFDVMPRYSANMTESEDTYRGRAIYPGGSTWTNPFTLPSGLYTFEWIGSDFDNATFDSVFWDEGMENYQSLEMLDVERTNTMFRFNIYIPEDHVIERLEARVHNLSDESILIETIMLWKNR